MQHSRRHCTQTEHAFMLQWHESQSKGTMAGSPTQLPSKPTVEPKINVLHMQVKISCINIAVAIKFLTYFSGRHAMVAKLYFLQFISKNSRKRHSQLVAQCALIPMECFHVKNCFEVKTAYMNCILCPYFTTPCYSLC